MTYRCRSRRRRRARRAAERGAVARKRHNFVAGALGHRGGAREATGGPETKERNMGKTWGKPYCRKMWENHRKTMENLRNIIKYDGGTRLTWDLKSEIEGNAA